LVAEKIKEGPRAIEFAWDNLETLFLMAAYKELSFEEFKVLAREQVKILEDNGEIPVYSGDKSQPEQRAF